MSEMWPRIEMELQLLIEPQISPYCGPLFFARSLVSAAGDNVIANGSFGLVNTGKKKLLVTCRHVWEGYQTERQKDSSLRMCICLDRGNPVGFDKREPSDQDASLDIVTFDMAPFLAACVGCRFYSLHQNPPPRVVKGNRIVLKGYQGIFRLATADSLGFGSTTYSIKVSDVSGMRLVASLFKTKQKFLMSPIRKSGPETNHHGGISGSPCFLVEKSRPPRLVGIVTEYGQDSLWFTHVGCLNPDGTINKP